MSPPAGPAFSFNEVVALVTKAARGAGLGWGHAEDLGRAARWLAEHGFTWDAALCNLLAGDDAGRRASEMLEIADWAAYAAEGATRTFHGDADAIWILPLVSVAIFGRTANLTIRWSGATIHLGADGAVSSDRHLLQSASPPGAMTLEAVSDQPAGMVPMKRLGRPGSISPAALARLSALADLTLVPASEASRAKGAGSVRSDND